MSRTVTDTLGTAGSTVLEDWLHDYYGIDDDEAECLYAAAYEN